MQSVQSKKRWTWLQGAVLVLFLLSSTLAFAQNRSLGPVPAKQYLSIRTKQSDRYRNGQNRRAASGRERIGSRYNQW